MIEEKMNIPGISGYLKVFRRYRLFGSNTFDWQVQLVVTGPDGRYNPAVIFYDRRSLPGFVDALSRARARLDSLPKTAGEGVFAQVIGNGWSVEVLPTGDAYARFEAASETRIFSRLFYEQDLETTLQTLNDVPLRAEVLARRLRDLGG